MSDPRSTDERPSDLTVENDLAIGPSSVPGDRYRQILDTAPDALVVIDRNGNISFANRQTETLFGYPREELLGRPLEILLPERFRRGHTAHMASYFSRPSTRHMGSGLGLFGRRVDGTEMDIEVSLSPVNTHDGMLVCAAIRDISERKRIEGLVKVGAERLTSAVESIKDAFALFDANDELALCNSVYRALLGHGADGPLVGRPYAELLDLWLLDLSFPNDATRKAFRAARIAARGEATSTYDVRTRDGRSFRVNDRRTAEGGVVTTVWDITEDDRQAEELRQARAAAEAGSAAKSDFLASMSHELRTPLNAILGFAQLLRRDKKEPLSLRHRERTDHILKGGEHLLRLIDDILDLSRIEAGGVSISPEPVDVDQVLQEVVATLEPAASRSNVKLTVAAPTGLHLPKVSTDRTRFVQILMNYGSNAIKYNRRDGTVIFAVSVPHKGVVRVTVSDTGMGIPTDKQDKMFQPFQRAGQETGPIEGTGIGLAITKRLAELLEGAVGFRSIAGEGSDFWVEMPAHEMVMAAPVPVVATDARRLDVDRRGSVLYVEDNPANVIFMQDLLGSFEGIDLVSAPTAEMGVQLARARKPDVILMDINLPGMSGFDALRILSDWPETRDIPVIALTAAASDRDRQRGERAGFFRYLTKPIKVDELESVLETLLRSLK